MAADDDLEMYREKPKKPIKKAAPVSNDDDLEMYREKPKTPKRFPKEKDQTDYSFTRPLEFTGGLLGNAYEGAEEFGTSVRNTIGDVEGTAAKIRNTGGKLLDASYRSMSKSANPFVDEPMPVTVAKVLAEPYKDGLANALAKHPYARAADIVTVAGLPAGAGLTVAGRAGQAAGAVGRAAARVAPSVANSRAVGAARAVANTPVGPLGTVGEIAGAGAKALVAPTLSANDAAAFGFRRAVPAIASRARAIADPVQAKMHEVVGGVANVAPMRAALARPPVLPFDVPTPGAQITSQMNAPGIAGLQKVGDAVTGANIPRAAAQTRAMQNAVQSIRGGTATPIDQRITDFIAQRDVNKARNYGVSDNQWFQMTPDLENTLSLPFNNRVVPQAVDLQRQNLNAMGQPAAYNIAAIGPLGTYNRLGTPVPTPGLRMLSGRDADLMKKGLDDIAFPNNPAVSGVGPEIVRGVRNARGEFVNEVDAAIPSYAQSRAQFAADSNNVDATTYARSLSNSLQNAAAGEGTIFSDVGSFSNMRDRAMDSLTGRSAIRRSTGQPRYPLGERSLLRPDESARLDAVQNLIGREASLGQQTRGVTPPKIDTMLSDAMGFRSDTPFLGSLVKGQNANLEREVAEAVSTGRGLDQLIARYGQTQQGLDDIAAVYHAMTNRYNPLHPFRVMNNNPAMFNVFGQRDQQEPQQ
jgi:hypothetical protein